MQQYSQKYMAYNYRPGDKVIVVKNDWRGFVTPFMSEMAGHIVTIAENRRHEVYYIREDGGRFSWVDACFVPVDDYKVKAIIDKNKASLSSLLI